MMNASYRALCASCIQKWREAKKPLTMLTGFGSGEDTAPCDLCGRRSNLAICDTGSAEPVKTNEVNAIEQARV